MDTLIDGLIEEYTEQRLALKKMIADLECLKAGIEKLFPDRLDARNLRFIEEKIKAVTDLFKAILEIRKELGKNIKDEIELRRKIGSGTEEEDIANIAELAKKVQSAMQIAHKL